MHGNPQVTTIVPDINDVLLGRGRAHSNHPANRYLHFLVKQKIPQYNATTQRLEKFKLSMGIVDIIIRSGRFLRFDKGKRSWIVLGIEEARLVVGQTLRNHRLKSNPRLVERPFLEEAPAMRSQHKDIPAESKAPETIELFTDEELRSVLLTYEDVRDNDNERVSLNQAFQAECQDFHTAINNNVLPPTTEHAFQPLPKQDHHVGLPPIIALPQVADIAEANPTQNSFDSSVKCGSLNNFSPSKGNQEMPIFDGG